MREFEIVGIAAPTNAGKTTLLAELGQRIQPKPTIYSFDEYDLYPSGSEAMERELIERKITNWEDPNLFDQDAYIKDLERIKWGLPVVLQTRSRESLARRERKRVITPSDLNIVEGVFIYHDPRARELFDTKFFIDIPIDEMVTRRLARTSPDSIDPWDDKEYIQREMVKGTELYVMPQRKYADVILDGLLPTSDLADIVVAELNQKRLK